MTTDPQAASLSAPLKSMTDEEGREAEAAELKRRLDANDMASTMQLYKSWQLRALKAEARAEAAESALTASPVLSAGGVGMTEEPIPMVLYCPACHTQHRDAPQPEKDWDNPPHRSHECQTCGCVWRPADVNTTGVHYIDTIGKRDWTCLQIEAKEAALSSPPTAALQDVSASVTARGVARHEDAEGGSVPGGGAIESKRVSSGRYTVLFVPTGHMILLEADRGGRDHNVHWPNEAYRSALLTFADDVIRLHTLVNELDQARHMALRAGLMIAEKAATSPLKESPTAASHSSLSDAGRMSAPTDAAALQEGWKPIETAPKDGTELLLWNGAFRIIGRYYQSSTDGWWVANAIPIEPVKWQPLPAPPEQAMIAAAPESST